MELETDNSEYFIANPEPRCSQEIEYFKREEPVKEKVQGTDLFPLTS